MPCRALECANAPRAAAAPVDARRGWNSDVETHSVRKLLEAAFGYAELDWKNKDDASKARAKLGLGGFPPWRYKGGILL